LYDGINILDLKFDFLIIGFSGYARTEP
jgi:hypothetical protein